jgi:hypothetical protein
MTVFANEEPYTLEKIAQLNHKQSDSSEGLQLVTHPNNTEQYFTLNNTGQIYFIDDVDKPQQVLNLNHADAIDSSVIKLTAMVLHPNFALREQTGYNTFYTAHLELLDVNSKTKRIIEQDNDLKLQFDAVITEWQFNSSTYHQVDLNTKREVVRISVPDNSMTIKQMSFNPYTKSWNDGFGLLYIALNGESSWKQPLYSGVVLRINPAPFGLRSFTVPHSNPFIKNSVIKDEIYLLGAQNIQQFTWPDKNNDDFLISHKYNNESLLSLLTHSNDWRDNLPENVFYRSDIPVNDLLFYQGSLLPSLRNKLLLLIKNEKSWEIESLKIKRSVNENISVNDKPQQEWQLTEQQLTPKNDVSLSTNREGAILIFDHTSGSVTQIISGNATKGAEKVTPVKTDMESTNSVFIFFVLIVVAVFGLVFYLFKQNNISAKAIVRKQFAHLELSESQQQIGLFHRHQSSIDTIVDIADITICEVKLNDITIGVINKTIGHGFNHEKEQDLRDVFEKEKVDKMIDGKIRQVSLSLTDINKKYYTVCLYMRKGNDRVTKQTYSVVIEGLIDWCWLFGEKINADETSERKKKPIVSSKPELEPIDQSNNRNSLYTQPEEINPAKRESLEIQPTSIDKLPEETIEVEEEIIHEPEPLISNSTVDTELVNALEKLVDLKQQGFLTPEEFTVAKENLLRSLFDKSTK